MPVLQEEEEGHREVEWVGEEVGPEVELLHATPACHRVGLHEILRLMLVAEDVEGLLLTDVS